MKGGKKAIQTSLGKLLTLKSSLSQKDQGAENRLEAADTNLNARNEKSDQTTTADMAGHPTKPSRIVGIDADICDTVDNPIKAGETNNAATILTRTEESQEHVIDSSVLYISSTGGYCPSVSNSDSSSRQKRSSSKLSGSKRIDDCS